MLSLLEEGADGGVKSIVIVHSELCLEVEVCWGIERHNELEEGTFSSFGR